RYPSPTLPHHMSTPLYSPPHHSPPPSFPTRRSSDLAGKFLDTERIGPVIRHRTKVIEPIGVGHRAEVARVLADLFVVTMQVAKEDRKSTRLNSSHVKISYAVFCLKKKKKIYKLSYVR